jgi:mRNA interferase YafQ
MLKADFTHQFKKDYKLVVKRGWDLSLADAIIRDLINEIPLDERFKDHPLSGNFSGCRECHIKADWLLIYQVGNGVIVFTRTGTHADLFSR